MVKALDGLIEACAGVFFYFIGYNTINAALFTVFQGSLPKARAMHSGNS